MSEGRIIGLDFGSKKIGVAGSVAGKQLNPKCPEPTRMASSRRKKVGSLSWVRSTVPFVLTSQR